jgi:hypothetical protein
MRLKGKRLPPFKSISKSYVANGRQDWKGSEIAPTRGPNGGRMVLDRLWCVADVADFNVASTAIQGEDFYRFFKRITVEQVGGRKRWDLTGDATRIALYGLLGDGQVPEYADSSVANDQAVEVRIPIPFEKPFAFDGRDYAIPIELIDHVSIHCADLSELEVSGGTVTIDSASYYLLAECHEEFDIVVKAEDEIRQFNFDNTSGLHLTASGRLQDLFVYARGASGGGSLANFTDVRISGFIEKALTKEELADLFAYSRGAARNDGGTVGGVRSSSPFIAATPRAVPILWSYGARAVDSPVRANVQLEITNSVSSLIGIARIVKPKSGDVAAAVWEAHRPTTSARFKTSGKSARTSADWTPAQRAFLPQVVPDPSTGVR